MNILFFTENLFYGGKERRLLELIGYLKTHSDYSMALVITEPEIHFNHVYDLGIPVKIIKRTVLKYDPLLFIKFYKFCSQFKPDIIHTWGKMTTFYAIPVKLLRKIPLISNLVADARRDFNVLSLSNGFIKTDILFSDVVLSNSNAGLRAYKIKSPKAKVISNGVDLKRFQQQFNTENVKKELGVSTKYMILMIASFTRFKDYDLFIDVAKEIRKIRSDASFVAVGDGPEWSQIEKRVFEEQIDNVILTGSKNKVEIIIAASDIGLLCTYSEGISNSIIEFMALGKPVISTDMMGGSKEIITDGVTGYCTERNVKVIAARIDLLLNNAELRVSMGNLGKERINSHFTINRMGEDFNNIYKRVLSQS